MEALTAIEAEWWDLWERDTRATPFQSPAWLLPWVRRLWGGGKMLGIALRRNGRLAGLAPFFLWGFGGSPEVIRVSFLGSGITDYLDILAEPGLEDECARSVIAALWDMRQDWRECDLQELRAGSPLLRVAERFTLPQNHVPCSICPVAGLATTIDAHLAKLDGKFRTGLRRAETRLRARGALEFRRDPALIETLFRLHAARWQERSEEGMLATERLQTFHREAADGFRRRGMLRICGIFLDGDCLAVQYNIAAKGRAYAYLSGFDPDWSKFSPGAVLLKHSIADAIDEGMFVFDFLRKPEPFKYLWGAEDQANFKLTISQKAALPAQGVA